MHAGKPQKCSINSMNTTRYIDYLQWYITLNYMYDKLASTTCPRWHISHILKQQWRVYYGPTKPNTVLVASCLLSSVSYLHNSATNSSGWLYQILYRKCFKLARERRDLGEEIVIPWTYLDVPYLNGEIPTLSNGFVKWIIIHHWYLN